MKIKKIIPKMLADDIVSVQPMTGKTDTHFEFREPSPAILESIRRQDKAVVAIDEYMRENIVDYDTPYEIPCPNCGGTLTFAVSSWNGHRRAICSTKSCVGFIE